MNSTTRNRFALTVGAVGILAGIMTTAMTPALGIGAITSASIVSARNNGPITLNNSDKQLVSIRVPAGKWLITGKMWADSVSNTSTVNTAVGCSIWKGSAFLDNSAFNLPKINGSSAGVNIVNAVITLRATATIYFKCDDFGSQAVAHTVVLTAIS